MPHEFDAAITTYHAAQRLCQTLSSDALYGKPTKLTAGTRL